MEKDWTTEHPAVFAASARKVGQEPSTEPASVPTPAAVTAPLSHEEPPAASVSPPEPEPMWTDAPRYAAAERSAQPKQHAAARRASRLTTMLAVLFLAGVAYGAILAGMLDGDTAAALEQMTRGYLAGRAESSFGEVFLRAVSASLMLGGAIFVSGFSAVGQPFAIFFLFFRAIGLGMSMGYFYTVLDGKGILLALVLLLPAGALAGYALLLACREALRLSGRFFAAMTKAAVLPPKIFRIYAVKFLIIAGMLALAALLDAGCTRLFLIFWAD